jgi:hypothetical protein
VDWNKKSYDCFEGRNIWGRGDITGIVAYNMQQCIDACATFNAMGGMKCAAVLLVRDLAKDYGTNKGAYCWLKNVTTPLDPTPMSGVMFAVLKT